MAKTLVSVSNLTAQAKTYDKVWRTLPLYSLTEVAQQLRLNMQKVEKTHVLTTILRGAGNTSGYAPDQAKDEVKKLLDFYQSELKVERVKSVYYDNTTLYDEIEEVLVKNGKPLDNRTKKDPLEKEIIDAMVLGHGEDVAFACFFAERDPDNLNTVLGSFTGLFPQLDILIAGEAVSKSVGNLAETAELSYPTDKSDVKAFDELVKFVRSAHPLLRRNKTLTLYISQDALFNAQMAFNNRFNDAGKFLADDAMLNVLRSMASAPNLTFASHESYGSGSRLILQPAGNMDLGYDTSSGGQFVQVRNVDHDPNVVQFWLQASYGTRFRQIHPKVFFTNDKINTMVDLTGDFKQPVKAEVK